MLDSLRLRRSRTMRRAAERLYGRSLKISERLGNQAGAAAASSQLGRLRTALDYLPEAVGFHTRALAIRQQIGLPEMMIDLRALIDLRTRLENAATE